MEILILILSSMISVLSPTNLVADKVAENAIRSQFQSVEVLKVRIDNAPIHNPISGRIDRLRVAGRGLFPFQDVRIEALELETDRINTRRSQLQRGRVLLDDATGVGVRIVFREEDVTKALQSPIVTKQLQTLLRSLSRGGFLGAPGAADTSGQEYRIVNPSVRFLADQRVAIALGVEDVQTAETLNLAFTSGIEVIEGRQFRFVQSTAVVNGQPIPSEFVQGFANGFARQYDLGRLEKRLNVNAKVLRLQFQQGTLEAAAVFKLPAGFKI